MRSPRSKLAAADQSALRETKQALRRCEVRESPEVEAMSLRSPLVVRHIPVVNAENCEVLSGWYHAAATFWIFWGGASLSGVSSVGD